MTKLPRLLVLTKLAPWRLNGGALIRNYWLIDALARSYAVDLVCADNAPAPPEAFAARLASVRQFARAEGRAGKIARGVDALAGGQPLYVAGSVPAALTKDVAALLAGGEYAAVQTDLNMVPALPATLNVPLIYNAHNCEYALQTRRARAESGRGGAGRAVAAVMALDAARLGRLEAETVGRSHLVAACSNADLEDLAELVQTQARALGFRPEALRNHLRRAGVLVPNGVDTAAYDELPPFGDERTILITGSMDWRPNRVGLDWFLETVLPALRARADAPPFSIRVAGRMGPALVAELQKYPELTAVPNPVRMQDELAAAAIVAAPITASSGTRLRILEAWAARRPVVTTSHGALGLDYEDGRELLVRDDPAAFAGALLELLSDRGKRQGLADAARRRVTGYDWQPIGARYREHLAAMLAEGRAVSPA